jgi:hypothetical protein
MTSRLLDLDAVNALRAAALRFRAGHAVDKSRALATCAARDLADPAVLVAYHDCLLCLLAYPETRALRVASQAELKRVALAARSIVDNGPARARARLANSGLAWTPVTINFGWDIARWLVQRFPAHADIDSFGEDGAPPQSVLADAFSPMEYELAASDESAADFVASASAGRSRLAWLVGAFERLPCGDALREHLFETLRPFIAIRPRGSMLSRTFVRGLPARTFFHHDGRPRPGVCPRTTASTSSMPAAPCSRRSDAKPTRLRARMPAASPGSRSAAASRSPSTRCAPSAEARSTRTSG